ncbi:DNA recombination protein RmuC [Geobacter argillaceus]|uniref:DNA recombination protein RmuC n=1 Tax=Geobacter argillaceus TaxID=345631 RepID=A0A562WQS3_9BACT|nr:DNA recombination protein RmuC [Geobacter argillaceus]TWJ32471.1 DNA recombination protein RmuC [Geobacter argillaceus]
MTQTLLLLLLLLTVACLVLLVLLLRRGGGETAGRLDLLDRSLERSERALRDELARLREEMGQQGREGREEQGNALRAFGESLLKRMTDIAGFQKTQLDTFAEQLKTLTQLNEQKLNTLRETVESQLKSLQEDNSAKLEQMRAVVDEKLHATLEKRLGESFKLVSDRLEMVHKGLGEMQSLAVGVGDLKKVLTNVKTRGNFGEIQLGSLLEQLLTPEQYAANVATRPGSSQRVEFAIKLPGKSDVGEQPVWLPIDAKFPQEDYLRLLEAQEQGNPVLVEESSRQLEKAVQLMARDIRDKYLAPPHTTDFGIMFLPTEGLYAEVLRRTGLCETLQRECRVVITGPTTLAALLNSLQLGFRTLAIEKRSSEVWSLLGAVKSEFATFGDILEKTKKKLQEAGNSIDAASVRSRAIERKLKNVQEMPAGDATGVVGTGPEGNEA